MTQALLLNIAIIAVIIICLVCLHNPLALFGLLLMKELPYGLMMLPPQEEEEEESKPMGFIQ